MKLIFIGPQGSGKGTQAKILAEKLNIPHISTGDLFRSLKGELKQQVDKIINKGDLVPDELTLEILKKRLEQPDAQKGFILDGFPRNLNQAELLKTITHPDKVIEITLPDEEAIRRISGRQNCKACGSIFNKFTNPPKQPNTCNNCNDSLYQRADDTEEAVKKRLKTYHNETEPILDFYKDNLIQINGQQAIEKIAEDINDKLK
ncbi:MAG: adenylate kinase [archaeon]